MYPVDDTLILLRQALVRARELEALVHAQIARSAALRARAGALRRPACHEELTRELEEVLRAGKAVTGDAREHVRRSRLLVARSRISE